MSSWFANLIDPFPSDRTAPPRTFWAFLRWAVGGSEKALGQLLLTSLLTGLAEAAGALLTGWAVDATAKGDPGTFIADHSVAIVAITLPADTRSPVLTLSAVIFPAAGDGMAMVALSVSSVMRPCSAATESPGFTRISMTSTSAKSPRSGTTTSTG